MSEIRLIHSNQKGKWVAQEFFGFLSDRVETCWQTKAIASIRLAADLGLSVRLLRVISCQAEQTTII